MMEATVVLLLLLLVEKVQVQSLCSVCEEQKAWPGKQSRHSEIFICILVLNFQQKKNTCNGDLFLCNEVVRCVWYSFTKR